VVEPSRHILAYEPPARIYACIETGPRWYQWHKATTVSEFAESLTADCVQCGIRLNGNELFHLATTSFSSAETSPRLQRILQAYCSRKDCPSYYYQLDWVARGNLNWPKVREAIKSLDVAEKQDTEDETEREADVDRAERRAAWGKTGLRLLAAVVAVLFLWAARQYYIGGTVPWLRQPESFTVDPASLEEAPFPPDE